MPPPPSKLCSPNGVFMPTQCAACHSVCAFSGVLVRADLCLCARFCAGGSSWGYRDLMVTALGWQSFGRQFEPYPRTLWWRTRVG